MALIKCTECGNEISEKARTCPRCGAPVQSAYRTKEVSVTVGIIGVLINTILGVIALIWSLKTISDDASGYFLRYTYSGHLTNHETQVIAVGFGGFLLLIIAFAQALNINHKAKGAKINSKYITAKQFSGSRIYCPFCGLEQSNERTRCARCNKALYRDDQTS